MARVTIEDCIVRIPNLYELLILAAQRARQIAASGGAMVPLDNDKPPIVALREIAEGLADCDELRSELVRSFRRLQPLEREAPTFDELVMPQEPAESQPAAAPPAAASSKDAAAASDKESAAADGKDSAADGKGAAASVAPAASSKDAAASDKESAAADGKDNAADGKGAAADDSLDDKAVGTG